MTLSKFFFIGGQQVTSATRQLFLQNNTLSILGQLLQFSATWETLSGVQLGTRRAQQYPSLSLLILLGYVHWIAMQRAAEMLQSCCLFNFLCDARVSLIDDSFLPAFWSSENTLPLLNHLCHTSEALFTINILWGPLSSSASQFPYWYGSSTEKNSCLKI